MILLVVKALILTMLIGVVGIFSKNRMNIWWYAVIFVLMLISQWAFSRPLNAEEFDRYNHECNYEMTTEAQEEIQLMVNLIEFRYCGKALTKKEKESYKEKL